MVLQPGDPMYGESVAEVVESRHPEFASGEIVLLQSGWQEYSLSSGGPVRRVDPALAPDAFCRLMRGENFGKALVSVARHDQGAT